MRVIKLTKAAKEQSIFSDLPALMGCSRHEWGKTYIHEGTETNQALYCKKCGFVSEGEKASRYFKKRMLDKLMHQEDLLAAYYLIDKGIKEDFIQGLRSRTDEENKAALEKLILDIQSSKDRFLSEKFELMKM